MRVSSAFSGRLALVPLLLLCLCRGDGSALGTSSHPAPRAERTVRTRLREALGRLPISFEANRGQADAEVRFLSRGPGYTMFFTSTEAVLVLRRETGRPDSERPSVGGAAVTKRTGAAPAVLRMKLVGSRGPAEVKGVQPLKGKANYFRGSDRSRWRTDIPTYEKLRYRDVYPGIDLVYHGEAGRLEYDFVVAPGADAKAIRVAFSGARAVRDPDGDLSLGLAGAQIRMGRPVVYQEKNGSRESVAGSYVLEAGQIGFEVAAHDPSRALVIDPELVYSTYLGGSGGESGVFIGAIAVDASGSAYVTGLTGSTDFPTTPGAFQGANGGEGGGCANCDAFVSKIDAAGSALVYSTYLGGSRADAGWGIAVDASGSAYVVGITQSPDFPTTSGAFEPTCEVLPWGDCAEAFVAKIDPSGSALGYSTFLGPSAPSSFGAGATAVAVDAAGHAYVAGDTEPGFPVTAGAFQSTHAGGQTDGFVTELDPVGSSLVYSSLLGGSGLDDPTGIAIDASGRAYVTGFTYSSDFPTTAGAFQRTCPLGASGGCNIAFVTSVSAAGSALVYSTYLGGNMSTEAPGVSSSASGVAVDASGAAYVTGITFTRDFPTTPGAFQTALGGAEDDAFVTKLQPDGSSLAYSTYLGGSSWDGGRGIGVDAEGNAYVAGWTWSADFPVANAVQPELHGSEDAFVAKLNGSGSAITFSTYLGGSHAEEAESIAIDPAGNAHVLGSTYSADFPTVNPLQSAFGGGDTDYFVAKVGEPPSCTDDVTDQVEVRRSPFYWIPFTRLRFQWVLITNESMSPIPGPLAYVTEDLQNATLLLSRTRTTCFSPGGDPFVVIRAGRGGVLEPDKRTLALLAFLKTGAGGIAYTPRVLSGVPTR